MEENRREFNYFSMDNLAIETQLKVWHEPEQNGHNLCKDRWRDDNDLCFYQSDKSF